VTPKSQITVDATAAGSVAQLMVADGQHVTAGQTLLRLDSPDAQAQLSAAKAADAQAAAQGKKSSGGTSVVDFSQSESAADANAQKAFDAAQATAGQIADPAIKASILGQITSARNQYATASSDVRTTIANFNNGIASASDVFGSLSDAQRTQTQAAVSIAQKTVDSLTIKASVSGNISLRSGVGGASASGVDVSSLLSQLGGNLGSLAGAFIASLLIGILQTFMVGTNYSLIDFARSLGIQLHSAPALARLSLTQLAAIMPYMLMVAILIFRPRGLMGARET